MNHQRMMTLADLTVERVVERAVRRNRPAQHTLVIGGSANQRRGVLDRIEDLLRYSSSSPRPHIGRLRKAGAQPPATAAELWEEAASAAGLTEDDDFNGNGLARIEKATGDRLVVAIIDDLDTMLAAWADPGEALNLRWALQNVNDLMVIGGTDGPIGRDAPYEHGILATTFATQSLETEEPAPEGSPKAAA